MTTSHSLPSELTIYTVGELRMQWLTWLATVREEAAEAQTHDEAFDVDAAAVDEVDAAGMQLLLALSKSLSQEHRLLKLRHASRPLVDACNSLGNGALLADHPTIGATT
jgi:ABC-type transporter Mla MlaB component